MGGSGPPEARASAGEHAGEAAARHAGSMRYTQAVEAFIAHLAQVRRLSPATVRAYRSDLADLGRAVGDADVTEMDLEALRDWLWQATQRGDARSTLARRAAAGRSFF